MFCFISLFVIFIVHCNSTNIFLLRYLFIPLFVSRYIFKQRRSVTKDMANFYLVCNVIYYLDTIEMHSLNVFKISGQISFKIAVRLH